jgi:hypothetical protein
MMTPTRRLPSAVALDDAARLTGVPVNRLRGAWRKEKLVSPYADKIALADVVRAFVALRLQAIFGEQSGIGLNLARSVPEASLLKLLNGETVFDVTLDGAKFSVTFPREILDELRDEILATAGW